MTDQATRTRRIRLASEHGALATLTDDEADRLDMLIENISERVAMLVRSAPGTHKNALAVLSCLEMSEAFADNNSLLNVLMTEGVVPVPYIEQPDGSYKFERLD
jgi:hypothetical protein